MSQAHRLFPFIRPHLLLLVLALVLVTASGLLEAVIVMLLEPIFNLWSASSGGLAEPVASPTFGFLRDWLGLSTENAMTRIAIFLVVFSFFKGIFLYAAEFGMAYAGQSIVAALRRDLYEHLIDQSLGFFSRWPTGHLMSRIISDTERLQEIVSKTLTDFVRQVVLLFAFLGVVFYIDWKLSMFSLVVAPLILKVTIEMGKRLRKVSWTGQENLSEISNSLQETISGQRIVKAFGMGDYERSRFNALVEKLVHINLKATRITALSSPMMEFVGYLLFSPFLFYANQQISQGVSVGAFVSFVVALFKLYEPIRKLSRMHLYFEQGFACSSRIFELLETEIEIRDAEGAIVLPPFESEIRFDDVSFRYEEEENAPVLSNIDLTISRGDIVALVGASGAGKSTLVSLIPRFYEVNAGAIRIDGHDIRQVTQASLRAQIAIVSQDTFLFNDTLRNNIAYGRSDCPLERVVEAARAAYIDDFIEGLPAGYKTVIGERGQRLSGGQRQRLAIARAILKQAPILILDEATSALDSESELLVQKALLNLMKRCTTLVIAHRLSTIRKADRIVVLDSGRIAEVGNHQSLMERDGQYRRLHDIQFGVNTLQDPGPDRAAS